jgi:hypothetical protein
MRFRKLRIAWSVFWGVLAVLLIGLWVRSYWYREGWVRQSAGVQVEVMSHDGLFRWVSRAGYNAKWDYPWKSVSDPILYSQRRPFFYYIPMIQTGATTPNIFVPYWFSSFVAVALSATPWLRVPKRFSLRTLLIATTLVAVVLGLIVSLES